MDDRGGDFTDLPPKQPDTDDIPTQQDPDEATFYPILDACLDKHDSDAPTLGSQSSWDLNTPGAGVMTVNGTLLD